MRRIPFPNGWFSFAYSYNAIDFMTKADIRIAIQEMTRVLRPEGLIYVNVLSVDDPDSWEPFCPTALDLGSTGFAHFEDDELDVYLKAFDIEYKSKRDVQKRFEGRTIRQVDIEYIGRKR
jgi:SAM-dependent methyltransferase